MLGTQVLFVLRPFFPSIIRGITYIYSLVVQSLSVHSDRCPSSFVGEDAVEITSNSRLAWRLGTGHSGSGPIPYRTPRHDQNTIADPSRGLAIIQRGKKLELGLATGF